MLETSPKILFSGLAKVSNAKGGEYAGADMLPRGEVETCKRLGIKIVCGVGGEKVQSSRKSSFNYSDSMLMKTPMYKTIG